MTSTRTARPMPDLAIENVTVRFGGLVAVSNVSIQADAGSVTGLIGPNGAGKTTTFNACTGVVSTAGGQVRLGDRRLDGLNTAARAAAGLGRTFQRMELCDSMTVTENVAMGPEAMMSARRLWGQLVAPRSEAREVAQRTQVALETCGVTALGKRRAGDLSTGQRRMVELARAIASPFTFLLLDEPSSGLDVQETEHFGNVLAHHVAETGMGILLVEHDMALVARVCRQIYVLDFGQLIWSGATADALRSDIVRAAYLGSEAVEMELELDAHA